uniref:Uncharacterized protein n=1 Tax=Caenorhabditis japonica TaxID=281687 RepID=A0A8R1IYH0_CAEJA
MNNHNTRLEAFVIGSNYKELNRNEILKCFETKDWDSSERAGTYFNKTELLETIEEICDGNIEIPWKSGDRDIVREDGMLATIRVERNRFLFLVWHDRFPK